MPTLQDPTEGVPFSTELLVAGPLEPAVHQAWQTLLMDSKSPEKVFQTPEYFEFISQIPNKGNSQELLVAKDALTQEIIAIIPLRTGRRTLLLNIGSHTLLHLRLHTIALLGSIPLTTENLALREVLIDLIFKKFPEKNTIAMQSLPKDSDFYRYLQNSKSIQKKYGIYVKDGWRTCHTTPLPESYTSYLDHFKAKKRYNLGRQLKLLEKSTGLLQLVRVDTPEKIPQLIRAIKKLVPVQISKSFLNENQFTNLAQKKIKLSYILNCNEIPQAVIIGMKAAGTYHIHNIIYAQDKAAYSPGTSVLHLAIEDLIDNLKISLIDYGYGSPEHSHLSSNVQKLRGHVFLYQKTWSNCLMFSIYSLYSTLVNGAKKLLSRIQPTLERMHHKTQLPITLCMTFL